MLDIKQLVEKYHTNKENYLASNYNETLLRSDFLDPLFELLGWDIKNHQGKPTNEREVILEESLKENINENSKKPDYTFRLFSERKFFLEAKKPCVSIEKNPDPAKQIRRYGFTAKLKISVLSNFEYLAIYDCSSKVQEDDAVNKYLLRLYYYTEYIEKFDEIKSLLSKETVYSGKFDKDWQYIEENLKTSSVDKLFIEQINNWRLLLGKEIFKFYPDIKENLLNDYVQNYLNSIIFLRVCEDRNLEEYQTLLSFANKKDFQILLNKFIEADKKYNSGLFNLAFKKEIVKNNSSIFWDIIKQLYYPESSYSFSVFSSDILGNIYEIFISDKLSIINNAIVLQAKPENVDRDVITTPNFIIQDILKQTLIPYCQNKNDKEIFNIKIADIACGSGAFLLEAYQVLNDILIDYYLKADNSKLIQTAINNYKLSFETKRKLLISCIYGIDKDFNAVESARFGLLLKLLESEDINSVSNYKPILPNLSKNIEFGNSLIEPEDIKELSSEQKNIINPFDFKNIKFDIIVGNPPYMKTEDIEKFLSLEKPIYASKYKSVYKQYDKYYLFVEKGLSLLKENGFLGYILPSKFTKVEAGIELRKLIKNNTFLKTLISFGANQIFESKTTYTTLLILNKSNNEEFEYQEIKNLADWKIKKNDELDLQTIKISELNDEVWILVPNYLKEAYKKINSQSLALEKLIGNKNIFNGIQTSRNDIYVINPLKEDESNYYFEINGKEWKIEKELTRPYYETPDSKSDDSLNTYRVFKPNRLVIYPYKKTDNKIEFIHLEKLKAEYPNAYKYFISNKDSFVFSKRGGKRDIKPKPKSENEWYRYGRQQSLDIGEIQVKIVVGILSQGDKYAIDFNKTLLSSGGTAGYCIITLPNDCKYSIYYIQAILNSKYVEWFASLIGEVFRGGYIARGTKVLNSLPIRTINFESKKELKLHNEIAETQKKLIELQTQIDENSENKRELTILERNFKQQKEILDKLLKDLYGLGLDDNKIPSIKELYEIN